jgi:predicted ATPase
MGSEPAPQDVQVFIAALDGVDLARYRVVGAYTRYDEAVRNALQDARQKILAGFEPPGHKRENHLIWAAPGTGKTYFVQQVASALPTGVRYHEVNLAKSTEPEFRAALGRLDDGTACLCLIDEVDAKPQEPWPYEVLLPYLDAAVERGARFVFVLAGSSGASLDEIKQRIAARPKGADLLSRIPTGHEHVIGPMSLGDRLLIVLSQLRQAGQETERDIRAIEKLGLYYVALNPKLANARQLREFAVRAAERVPKTDHRVKYDHLFVPGDPENKAFWVQAAPVAERLVNSFVVLAGDALTAAIADVSAAAPSSDGAAVSPPIATAQARPHTNLPRQLTSFIGRKREIEEVKRLLPTTALLTLHGPGGCGKTRLAFQVAADLVDQYSDGVWVAELAALSDLSLVAKAVATALDAPEQPGRSLTETLRDVLRRKSLLLVLDNCEHLVTACADLADALLRACPRLRILATSREPLSVPGETIWDVPSLSVPEPSRVLAPEHLGHFDGVRLFAERAATSKPGFALTADNAHAVVRVCSQLEGIPLAIELAAARVRVLTIEQIAARLDDRFRLLTGGSRTALPRHQTLRATMDWSYGLLSEREQTTLRRLSVFAGGWTVEAAEAICAGGVIEGSAILDVLTSLVDKSLVLANAEAGEARYRLPETVRQYAAEKLMDAGDTDALKRHHCEWYLYLAEQAGPRWGGPAMPGWLDRLEREHDNCRAALDWSGSDGGDRELGLRLAVALVRFWEMHGHFSEGRRWLEGLIARCETAPPLLRAAALNAAGILAYRQGDYLRVSEYCSAALSLCEAHGDRRGAGRALHFLAHLEQVEGNYTAAAEMMERSVALHRAAGDAADLANSVDCLGEIARSAGDDAGARARTEEALTLYRDLGHARGQAHALHNLAYLQLHEGDAAGARALFRESLVLGRDLGTVRDQVFAVVGLACASVHDGEVKRVTRLLGAAATVLSTLQVRLEPAEDAEFQRALDTMRARLDPGEYATAWTEGQAMTLEQAVEYALAEQTE